MNVVRLVIKMLLTQNVLYATGKGLGLSPAPSEDASIEVLVILKARLEGF